MAAANLQLSPAFVQAFQEAQATKTRYLTARIDDVVFNLDKKGASTGDLQRDLETIKKEALNDDACMILVCVDEASSPKKWVLCAYVPETCKIKKRMLFASGRQDIKNKLGNSYFKGEAHAQDASDLNVENIMRDKTDIESLPYTMEELALKEDHALSARPGLKMEKGMSSVEFKMSKECEDAIARFKKGEIDWIECNVTGEERLGLVRTDKVFASLSSKVQSKIDAKEPRFYIAQRKGTPKGDRSYLIFSCPESSPIRSRMLYATCKASLLETGGIAFDKLLEVRSPDEVDDLFVSEELVDENAGKITHQDVSKPKRPGKR